MSAVCILTPIVVAGWPAFSAAIVAAASSMGYQVLAASAQKTAATAGAKGAHAVQLEVDRSEIVTSQLERDQSMSVTRDGVSITFSRDARGRAALCASGTAAHSQAELRALGEALSQGVVQQYVYQRLLHEMQAKGFNVVEEDVSADRSIRLKVRHWEN
jgi:hypothetical protein